MNDYISIQDAIDALKICDNNEDGINCYKCPLRDERWDGAWQDDETSCYRKLMRDSAELLSAQPEYELVTAEDFAKTMSENTIYSFRAWHSMALLELMEKQGFVICKKTM